MRRSDGLSGAQIVTWTGLGLGVGILAGFALSEWVGDVNRPRLQRMQTRLRSPEEPNLTPKAGADAVRVALQADPMLRDLKIEANPIRRGCVELRGWVPSRAARAHAARVTRALPGIESVVNSLRVRGEDDQQSFEGPAAEQSA